MGQVEVRRYLLLVAKMEEGQVEMLEVFDLEISPLPSPVSLCL